MGSGICFFYHLERIGRFRIGHDGGGRALFLSHRTHRAFSHRAHRARWRGAAGTKLLINNLRLFFGQAGKSLIPTFIVGGAPHTAPQGCIYPDNLVNPVYIFLLHNPGPAYSMLSMSSQASRAKSRGAVLYAPEAKPTGLCPGWPLRSRQSPVTPPFSSPTSLNDGPSMRQGKPVAVLQPLFLISV